MAEFRLAATLREEGNVPGALEHLRKAIELDPDNGQAHILLGFVHLQREDPARAEASLREGIRILAQREDTAATLSEARNMLGLALIQEERYDEAIVVLREAAADMLNRAPWYAWGNLGWAYYEKGAYRDAEEALRESVRVQPRFCVGHYRLGQTLFATDRFDDAETSLTHALEADERCGEVFQAAWKLRGETRARLGHREEAIPDFEHCVELGADTEDGRACRRFLEAD